MKTRDCLNIGLKLLGVYSALLGVTVAAVMLLNLVILMLQRAFERDDMYFRSGSAVVYLLGLVQPVAYLVCGFILTRKTDWCLKLIGYPAEGAALNKDSTP